MGFLLAYLEICSRINMQDATMMRLQRLGTCIDLLDYEKEF